MLQFVLGFMSAADYYVVRGDLRETDAPAVAAWLDKYCRENPLNNFANASANLAIELSKPE